MKPMTQDEALRIIRAVAELNTHDVPQPPRPESDVQADYERTLTRTSLDLIYEAARATEMVKKYVFHEHELSFTELMEAISGVRVACRDIEMLVKMRPYA